MCPYLFAFFFLTGLIHAQDTTGIAVCPSVKCSDKTDGFCMKYKDNTWTHYECPSHQECPYFSLSDLASKRDNVRCATETEEPEKELACPDYMSEGESCKFTYDCLPKLWCKFNEDTQFGMCVGKTPGNGHCLSVHECEQGYICSNGNCVKYFSVETGKPASHLMACTSGILRDGVCQEAEETAGSIPKLCNTNLDCSSKNGVAGECTCVPDEAGNAFCKLHQSDEPVKKYQTYLHNGNYASSVYQLDYITNFPIVQHAQDCIEDDARELKSYEIKKDWAEKCSAYLMSMLFTSLLLALLF